jgi:prolipoprotein diacylglyceryltransferase
MEFGLLAAAVVAATMTRAVIWVESRIDHADRPVAAAWEGIATAAIVGLGVGRLVAVLGAGVNPFTHPIDLFIIRGGVDTVGAAIGALATLAIVARHDLAAIADAAAPAAVAGLAGWHAGCLARGACGGTATGLPWAISGPGGVARHPVEVYAALILGAAAALLVLAWARSARPGVVAGAALGIAGLARLVTEPMRLGIGSGPVWWYAGAGVAGLVAATAAWRRGRPRA